MMNRIDPTNDRKYYACSQNGGCRGFVGPARRKRSRHDDPGADARTGSTPIEFAADPKFMFGASEFVYRMNTEPDIGQRVWQRISRDLTEGTELRVHRASARHGARHERTDANLVYAGSDSGRMWVSRNAMADPAAVTWTKLKSPVFPGRWVTRITVDPQNAKIAWATFSGWRTVTPTRTSS